MKTVEQLKQEKRKLKKTRHLYYNIQRQFKTIKMINELAKQVHQNAKAHGFFDKERNIGEMLCLIHSEVSEALEADRKNKYCSQKSIDYMNEIEWSKSHFETNIKNTFEDELADIMMRVMDLAAFKDIDLEFHIKNKMRYNSLRERYHGKKY